jgi:hemerythrin
MTFISWKKEYNTGTEKIDTQHRMLFDIINELHEAKETGKAHDVLDGILSKLIDYTKFHFSAEEALLEELNYPELESHKATHQAFIKQIGTMLESHHNNKCYVEDMLLVLLKKWLVTHILNDDMNALSYSDDGCLGDRQDEGMNGHSRLTDIRIQKL